MPRNGGCGFRRNEGLALGGIILGSALTMKVQHTRGSCNAFYGVETRRRCAPQDRGAQPRSHGAGIQDRGTNLRPQRIMVLPRTNDPRVGASLTAARFQ